MERKYLKHPLPLKGYMSSTDATAYCKESARLFRNKVRFGVGPQPYMVANILVFRIEDVDEYNKELASQRMARAGKSNRVHIRKRLTRNQKAARQRRVARQRRAAAK